MRIGIAFDLKPTNPPPPGAPDDWDEEFDSPATIQSIGAALRSLGHNAVELGNGRSFLEKLLADPPELVFNIAEGMGTSRNREARVPAVCEMLNIPCTGSDPLTLALCLDKDLSRRLVNEGGISVPKGIVLQPPVGRGRSFVYDGDYAEFPAMVTESELRLPLIAKPVWEGSSKGIRSKCLIEKADEIGPVIVSLWRDYHQAVLLEEFIAGEEVTVGVVENDSPRLLGIMRVVPKQATDRFVYSLEVKRDWENQVDYECPADLPLATMAAIESAAIQAYEILNCRDIARIDFRVQGGVPYFIEANPLPGLNPATGDIVILAGKMGIPYEELIDTILGSALTRSQST